MKYTPPLGTSDPNAPYVNGDIANGIMGSIPVASTMEEHQRELVNTITNSTQTPDDGDLMQVTRAVRDGKLNFVIDSGVPSQLVVPQLNPPITKYDAGLELRVLCAQTCIAGGTTIQVGALPPIPIKRLQGTALQAGDILAGQIADLVCDGTQFQLQNMGIAVSGAGPIDRYEIYLPYVHDTGTANHFVGLYSPALPNINEGRTVEIKAAFNNTGPIDFHPNNFPIHPVVHPDGTPMIAGDVVTNQICLLVFDGTTQITGYPAGAWQLISSRAGAVTKAVVTRPKRSLQFADPNLGYWGTFTLSSQPWLQRTPTMQGNNGVWTFSAFYRFPVLVPRPFFYTASFGGQLVVDCFLMAADAGGSWAGSAGDCTGLMLLGGDIDQCINLYYDSAYWAASGCSDADSLRMGFTGQLHNGVFLWGPFKDTQWHHLCWVTDNVTLGTSTVYIDGVIVDEYEVGSGSSTHPGSRSTMNDINRQHRLGASTSESYPNSPYPCRARIAEPIMIDGQALDWTHFARNVGGVFLPKDPDFSTLNPGVNGYWLNFTDGSAATSTTMGKDYSPNGNNFTPYNMTTGHIHVDYPGIPDSTETFAPFMVQTAQGLVPYTGQSLVSVYGYA